MAKDLTDVIWEPGPLPKGEKTHKGELFLKECLYDFIHVSLVRRPEYSAK